VGTTSRPGTTCGYGQAAGPRHRLQGTNRGVDPGYSKSPKLIRPKGYICTPYCSRGAASTTRARPGSCSARPVPSMASGMPGHLLLGGHGCLVRQYRRGRGQSTTCSLSAIRSQLRPVDRALHQEYSEKNTNTSRPAPVPFECSDRASRLSENSKGAVFFHTAATLTSDALYHHRLGEKPRWRAGGGAARGDLNQIQQLMVERPIYAPILPACLHQRCGRARGRVGVCPDPPLFPNTRTQYEASRSRAGKQRLSSLPFLGSRATPVFFGASCRIDRIEAKKKKKKRRRRQNMFARQLVP